MASKLKINFLNNKFDEFLDILTELVKIGDLIKIKITSEYILLYSTLGTTTMLAFKNYVINTSEFITYKGEIEKEIDVIFPNCKKLVKNLDLLSNSNDVSLEILYKESKDNANIARTASFKSGKLTVKWPTAESFSIRDISKESLDTNLKLENRNWSFFITTEEFTNIKKLSSINSKKIININIDGSKVILSEDDAWELEVSEIDSIKSNNLISNKKYLNCIRPDMNEIVFNMFDTFILIKDKNSNLMLSYEQDFSDDEL